MAGIWQVWEREGERLTTCAIVTTAAAGAMAELHSRMPVVLEPESWGMWLGEEGKGAARLMQAAPDGSLVFEERAPG